MPVVLSVGVLQPHAARRVTHQPLQSADPEPQGL